MARCPRVVRINGFKWKLYYDKKTWESLHRSDECVGVTFEQYMMAVKPGVMDVQDEATTVLHEILHAVYKHAFGPDSDAKRGQESVAGGLEGPLYTVLRDNPKLVAYLQQPDPL